MQYFTCPVDQHLPQLLLIAGVDEVKNTVASQIKLAKTRLHKRRVMLNFLCLSTTFFSVVKNSQLPATKNSDDLPWCSLSSRQKQKSIYNLPVPARGTCWCSQRDRSCLHLQIAPSGSHPEPSCKSHLAADLSLFPPLLWAHLHETGEAVKEWLRKKMKVKK